LKGACELLCLDRRCDASEIIWDARDVWKEEVYKQTRTDLSRNVVQYSAVECLSLPFK